MRLQKYIILSIDVFYIYTRQILPTKVCNARLTERDKSVLY